VSPLLERVPQLLGGFASCDGCNVVCEAMIGQDFDAKECGRGMDCHVRHLSFGRVHIPWWLRTSASFVVW
jgi:hypothetical protein